MTPTETMLAQVEWSKAFFESALGAASRTQAPAP